MIILKSQLSAERTTDAGFGTTETARYSDAGGLEQYGAYVQTLLPGAKSSTRHWHEQEDEFLYVLSGQATVIENDGAHVLAPGDAACWAAGISNAHHVTNESSEPCSYLIVGTRVRHDVCHYPDVGRTLYTEGATWRLVDAAGQVLKVGLGRGCAVSVGRIADKQPGPMGRTRMHATLARLTLAAASLLAAAAATGQVRPDAVREQRHAEQVVASLVAGDAVWLTTAAGGRFLGLLIDAPRPKGAVILAHGPGWHPDHSLTGELRMALADRGYVTLSLQMPVLAADEDDGAKYRELFPEAAERIAAGVRLLQGKGFARMAIVSHAMGTGMAYHWLKGTPQAPLFAWAALSFYGGFGDDMPKLAFPVLDIYGASDYRGIRWPAWGRKRALERVAGSKQIEVAEGGWFLAGGSATVLREVAAFLDAAPR